MAKIIINRKGEWMNRLRRFDIYIDGEKAGAVKNGGSEEFSVPAGEHTVQCRLSWYSSNTYNVTVGENDIKFLSVKGNMKGFGFLYILLLIVLLAPLAFRNASWINRDTLEWSRFAIVALVVIYFGYYSFFARNKYLRVGEDKSNIFNN
jgi:hypothetical protein